LLLLDAVEIVVLELSLVEVSAWWARVAAGAAVIVVLVLSSVEASAW
jgi:hypothetical protein